jgi:hypothetical protein
VSVPVIHSVNSQTTSKNEKKIYVVITTKRCVFISYKKDGFCRDISPHSVKEGWEGLLVCAMDHTRNGERLFYIVKITHIEDTSWESAQGKRIKDLLLFYSPIPETTTTTTTTVPAVPLPLTPIEWLREFGMERYAPVFKQNGYDTLHVVSVLNKSDLDTLGITISSHCKLFTFKVRDLCKWLN